MIYNFSWSLKKWIGWRIYSSKKRNSQRNSASRCCWTTGREFHHRICRSKWYCSIFGESCTFFATIRKRRSTTGSQRVHDEKAVRKEGWFNTAIRFVHVSVTISRLISNLAKISSFKGSRNWHLISFHLDDHGRFDENSATAFLTPTDFQFDQNPIRFTFSELDSFLASSLEPSHDPYDLWNLYAYSRSFF